MNSERNQTTPQIEQSLAVLLEHLVDVTKQRDDLLEAATAITTYWNNGNFARRVELWDHLRAVVEATERDKKKWTLTTSSQVTT